MNRKTFWAEVEQRTRENREIAIGGMPGAWAPVMEKVGLHFWKVGLVSSAGVTVWLWLTRYQELIQIVRVMVWR